jgi:hypothetical protein
MSSLNVRGEASARREGAGKQRGKMASCAWREDAGLRRRGYRLQAAGYRLQVTGCRLQAAGYRLQVAGCRLPVAGCVAGDSDVLTA